MLGVELQEIQVYPSALCCFISSHKETVTFCGETAELLISEFRGDRRDLGVEAKFREHGEWMEVLRRLGKQSRAPAATTIPIVLISTHQLQFYHHQSCSLCSHLQYTKTCTISLLLKTVQRMKGTTMVCRRAME